MYGVFMHIYHPKIPSFVKKNVSHLAFGVSEVFISAQFFSWLRDFGFGCATVIFTLDSIPRGFIMKCIV